MPFAEPRSVRYLDHAPIERWMELIIAPLQVPTAFGGTDQCMLMTFHDLTPLRRVEEMRADFVANASHELRTPLAALSGFIDTLQGPARGDTAAREKFLAIMRAQASRMARLIGRALSGAVARVLRAFCRKLRRARTVRMSGACAVIWGATGGDW